MRLLASIVSALTLSGPPPAPHLSSSVQARWDRVAQCETGGNWRWGSQFAAPRFEGGVGFATTTWAALVTGTYPHSPFGRLGRWFPHAFDAPRSWQIAVAQWLWLRGGYWGCTP